MNEPWKILIVDDDKQIHKATSLVLKDIKFQNRDLQLINAYSAEEAKRFLRKDKEIALILLDIVMESDDAGLKLIHYIRKKLDNQRIRIIIRTGQPGTAPENRIIIDYDINDYKDKSELTFQKLFTAVISSLRTFDYISQLEAQKLHLEHLVHLNSTLLSHRSQPENIIHSFNYFLNELIIKEEYPIRAMLILENSRGKMEIHSRLGFPDFTKKEEKGIIESLPESDMASKDYEDSVIYQLKMRDPEYHRLFLYLEIQNVLALPDIRLLQIFTNNIKIAFSNISLREEILNTQKDIITTLTEFIECRSTETASHVFRVSLYTRELGKLAKMAEKELSILEIAAPMHDLGKVAISDQVLKKPGDLTEEEFESMKKHTRIGFEILNKSNRKILKTAGLISLQHHERWDGTGYPENLAGEEINIMARIVALADVFDALQAKRSYKEAWKDEAIIQYFKKERGKHFDPHLTDLFLSNYSIFRKIADTYPD